VAVLPVIIDSQPDCLKNGNSVCSLLTLPLGTGTVLQYLVKRLDELRADEMRILLPAGLNHGYAETIGKIAGGNAEVIRSVELSRLLHEYEPADLVLFIDPRYWPTDGFDFQGLSRKSRDSRWALHAVAAQASADGMQEYVRFDEEGRVRHIRRFYDRVTWPETGAIPCSIVPVTAAEDLSVSSLIELRQALVERGMLSQDVPLYSEVADLSDRRTLLAWQERFIIDSVGRGPASGYAQPLEGVLVGAGCTIHPSARIVGPVIIQSGVTVKEGVTIIGPAVIGKCGKLERDARVVQAVVAADSVVSSGRVTRHTLAVGKNGQAVEQSRAELEGPVRMPTFIPRGGANMRLAERTLQVSGGEPRSPILKRAFDFVVAAAGLILLSPVFLITAILIKLDSPGPVFFHHTREGRGGEVFSCLKFRTMRQDAHQMQRQMYVGSNVDGPQFKLDYDPRVTRVGHWLRAANIDELPQLINVFLGQMSLVGPRPSPFRENQVCIPWRRARLSVRPGITGLWQICRHDRGGGDFHQWIAYDTMYVANMCFALDLKILIATLLTLGGKLSVPPSWIIGPQRATPRARHPEVADEPELSASPAFGPTN
jgi:lipopolysaccharide/colanic/teichoic acid biosynthesis glycosyltransferase